MTELNELLLKLGNVRTTKKYAATATWNYWQLKKK